MRMNERIKRALSVLLCLYMVVQYLPMSAFVMNVSAACTTCSYSNGICTVCSSNEPAVINSDSYYEIDNAGKLLWFATQVKAGKVTWNAKVTADITIPSGTTWIPIGYNTSKIFNATFDGGNYTIDLGTQTVPGNYYGLVANMKSATVKNVRVKGTFTAKTTSASATT